MNAFHVVYVMYVCTTLCSMFRCTLFSKYFSTFGSATFTFNGATASFVVHPRQFFKSIHVTFGKHRDTGLGRSGQMSFHNQPHVHVGFAGMIEKSCDVAFTVPIDPKPVLCAVIVDGHDKGHFMFPIHRQLVSFKIVGYTFTDIVADVCTFGYVLQCLHGPSFVRCF